MTQNDLAKSTLRSLGDALISVDCLAKVLYLNPIAEQLTGWCLEEAKGLPIDAVFSLDISKGVQIKDLVDLAIFSGETQHTHLDTKLCHKDGTTIPVSDSISPIVGDGKVLGVAILFRDETKNQKTYQKILEAFEHQSTHDNLTGLLNRTSFTEILEACIESARRDRTENVLLFVSLDRFRIVNDTSGYAAGDALLIQVSKQLHVMATLYPIARTDGDEFALLVTDCSLDRGKAFASRIEREIGETPFWWKDTRFSIGVSISLCPITHNSTTGSDAISVAGYALLESKRSGQVATCTGTKKQDTINLVSQIHRAITSDSFQLWRQPIFDLTDTTSPSHCEVLIRMVDNGGIVSPSAFLDTAERYGLIQDIDRWVLTQFFESELNPEFTYTINISPRSLSDHKFGQSLIQRLEKAASSHDLSKICFEITETAVIEANQIEYVSKLTSILHGLGCKVAIDDFGSGASNFWCLHKLKLDYLKIDGSLIQDLITPGGTVNRQTLHIVKAINDVGHAMGLKTVAEFVRTRQILETIQMIGIDFAQGYYMSKPISGLL